MDYGRFKGFSCPSYEIPKLYLRINEINLKLLDVGDVFVFTNIDSIAWIRYEGGEREWMGLIS